MKLLKLEQPNCRNCGIVGQFLSNQGVEFETVDVSKNPDMAVKYDIMSTPVVILLDESGEEVERSAGFNPGQLEEMINKLN